ncbi:hypothetical protein HPB49_022598 [Dermacentor silvarum]|uniref:Uncharacterized protein n=1 Tax=Dermacentor silvarum TaxID=543639 RepID=A0ACB8D8J8_DERSI|nr:hypothetical protein HPB49_022598 [Dermacentor silvarum]
MWTILFTLSFWTIQASSENNYRGLNSVDVRDLLKSAGDSYGCHSVVQSELRVLRTLKYRLLPPTPLVYAEVLLEVIGDDVPLPCSFGTVLFFRLLFQSIRQDWFRPLSLWRCRVRL